MKITSVDCDFLLVSVEIPVRGSRTDYGVLLVSIETDTGIRGIGLAHDHNALAVRQLILSEIGSFLIGIDFVTPAHIWHEAAFQRLQLDAQVPMGIVARGISAVDQALWDIWGRSLGEPVHRLLGGAQPEIEAYATFGLNIYNPEEEAEAARLLLNDGFRAFKLQGAHADRGRDVTVDAARVKRLREVVGPGCRIMLDGRRQYSLYQATQLAKLIAPYDIAFFDEPLYARDPVAHRRLREACPTVPLAARSHGGNLPGNRDLIAEGAVDVMGVNVMDQGGFTYGIKVAHLAEAYQLPLVTGGTWHFVNAQLIAAATNGWMTEYMPLAGGVGQAIFVDPLMPRNGKVHLSSKPGLGLELNEAGLREAKERGASRERIQAYRVRSA